MANYLAGFGIHYVLVIPTFNSINNAREQMPTTGFAVEGIAFFALDIEGSFPRGAGSPEKVAHRRD